MPAGRTTATVSVLAIVAALAVPARGADTRRPTPDCHGASVIDKVGDQQHGTPAGSAGRGPDNTDVVAGFFNSGPNGTTANIEVTDLDATMAAGSNGSVWYFAWKTPTATRYVKAALDSSGAFTYAYGTHNQSSGLYEDAGPTKGRTFAGHQGIISIEVPAAAGATTGAVLGTPFVSVYNSVSFPAVGALLNPADDGPDSLAGTSYTVGRSCPSARPQPLGMTVKPGSASSAAVKRGGGLQLTLKTSIPLSNLKLTLADPAGKAVASATRARLTGTARLTLRPKRTLRTGAHTLTITATDAAGAPRTSAFRIVVKN